MSAQELYQQTAQLLSQILHIYPTALARITDMVFGVIRANSAAPARIAEAICQLGWTHAKVPSVERRIRRAQNDPEITPELCVDPVVRHFLAAAAGKSLLLALDPTMQEDRVVLMSLRLCYRGRGLPLAWATWPANTPLKGDRMWKRVEQLIAHVAPLLPPQAFVICTADRAFGTPEFLDLLTKAGWHYIVRIQGQTRYQDAQGRTHTVSSLLSAPGQRCKRRAQVFKTKSWRTVSLVAFWGEAQEDRLILVSDLAVRYDLLSLYRRRYHIETGFRDDKSLGWRFEQSQVTCLAHQERLLIAMALATWLTVLVGGYVAECLLSQPPTGRRRTCPWEAKRSLFQLGLFALQGWLGGGQHLYPGCAIASLCLTHLNADIWQRQCRQHHAKAYVFAQPTKRPKPVRP